MTASIALKERTRKRRLAIRIKLRAKRRAEKDYTVEHKHDWDYKWLKRYRICPCGFREWQVDCWNAHRWQPWASENTFAAHPGLSDKVDDGANYVWSRAPHLIRSLDILPMDKLNEPLTLIGAGSIGSFTGLVLSKMGFMDLTIFDSDIVSPENVGTQIYGTAYGMGEKKVKVHALREILKWEVLRASNNQNVLGINHRFDGTKKTYAYLDQNGYTRTAEYKINGTVLSTVDSMDSRKDIWKACKNNKKVNWLIDARMGAEYALLYVINPNDEKDIASFEKTLHSDKDAVQEPCTAKATVYTAFMIAGLIGKAVKDVLVGTPYPRVVHWNIGEHSQTIWKGGEKEVVKGIAVVTT